MQQQTSARAIADMRSQGEAARRSVPGCPADAVNISLTSELPASLDD